MAHGHHGHNHHGYSRHGAYGRGGSHERGVSGSWGKGGTNSNVTDDFILQKVNAMLNQTNTSELIQFLSALNTTDGQRAVKQLGVDPAIVPKLLAQLRGSPQDIAAAREKIKTLLQTFINTKQRKISKNARGLFQVYKTQLVRQAAQQQVKQASVDNLKTVLGLLAKEENNLGFRGINFGDLLQTLNSKGQQGLQEVIDKLVKWIGQAPCDDLQRAFVVVQSKMPANKPSDTTFPPGGNLTTTLQPAGNLTTIRPPMGNFTTNPIPPVNATTPRPPSTTTPPRPEPVKRKKIQP